MGYRLTLLFLWLSAPEIAVNRVQERVLKGGHSVPTDVIIRRYHAGLRNMRYLYLPAVATAMIYDNSAAMERLVAERRADGHLVIRDAGSWDLVERATR